MSLTSPAVVLRVRTLSPRPIARSIFLISAHVKPRWRYLFRCLGRMCWMSSLEAVVIPGCHERAEPLVILGIRSILHPDGLCVVRVVFPIPRSKRGIRRGNERCGRLGW